MASQSSTPSFEPVDSKSIEEAIEEDLSFVMADEAIDKVADEMSKSKYSQVVFPEIAESYANDCDIICKFAYNFEIPITSSTSDRIGLYRVPYFQPHEYLAVRWVHEAKENCLVFNAADIPKDEDFYQFQYLRTENGQEQAIGASIPFQIQIPKNDELCTVEDDEEFMVVRSKTSFITEQMTGQLSTMESEKGILKEKVQELEAKYKKLLELSEKVQADLNKKSEACKCLEEELQKFKEDNEKLVQLKTDLAAVLQDKLVLEEKLHRFQKAIQTIQTDRDLLAGERDQANREKELLLRERDQVVTKNDEFKNMLNATTKAKELAVNELKAHILNKDDQQKIIQNLHKRVEELETLNQELVVVNKDLITAKDFEVQKLKDDLKLKEAELETIGHKLEIKNNEFELLRQEMVERSKTKFNEIDALKKQLAEAERNLAKFVEGQNVLKETPSSICSEDGKPHEIEIKLETIEKMIRDTRSEMKEYMSTSTIANSTTSAEPLNTSVASSMISSTDSRHMLDDNVIHSQMVLNEPDSDEIKAVTSPLKQKISQVIEGFKQLEDAPQNCGEASSSNSQVDQKIKFNQLEQQDCSKSNSSRDASPEMSSSPKRKNLLQRGMEEIVTQFLPQLPGFSQSASAPVKIVEEYDDGSKTPIREQPRGEMPEPLVPEVLTSRVRVEEEVASSDFSDLVNWARGNLASTSIGTRVCSNFEVSSVEDNKDVIVITDDGRTLTREESRLESRLKCPICNETFGNEEVRALELHVDQHLATSHFCPVCNASYPIVDKEAFESHVQDHFDNDEEHHMRRTWSFMDFD